MLGEIESGAGASVDTVEKTDAGRLSGDPLWAVAGASLSAARRFGNSVVTITSAVSGEGRSHLAASLAVSFGNRGLRAVLVELDGRGTRAGTYLGFHDGRPGVVEFLENPALSPADLIQNTQSPGVAGVPMGAIRGSLDLASARTRLPLLMAGLLERADVVVVDAPPVLQGDGPGLISTLPGIAVMAVAARRTGQRDAVSSANVLRESGVRLTGYVYASLVAGSSFPRSARARVRSLRRSLPAFIHNLFS
jgi:Mrp family chromosome partitioning ATPase